jgi:hypothetical protein
MVAVGVDEHAAHLRAQPLKCTKRQGLAVEGLQAFVQPAHAQAPATGQHQASDVRVHPPM